MDYLKQSFKAMKKTAEYWLNPNENPTKFDKYAFNLLDKGEVDLFIEFVEMNNVNLNVVDYNKASLLMKAQGIPIYNNEHTKLLSYNVLIERTVKAIDYLVKKGVDINYRGKNGETALLSASHWGRFEVVEALLKHGADPNFGSKVAGFCTNPLLSATFKNHKRVVELLILYGADPAIAEEYSNSSSGFKLTQADLDNLNSIHNIYLLSYKRKIEQELGMKTVLGNCSENMFNQICLNV